MIVTITSCAPVLAFSKPTIPPYNPARTTPARVAQVLHAKLGEIQMEANIRGTDCTKIN
jgi:hypothetical protein